MNKNLPYHFVNGNSLIYISSSEVAQLCPTLWDPMDCSLPGSSIHGIFYARVLELVAISFSRGSSRPGTPVFLPGESQGWGSLVGCHLRGHTESDMTEVT